MILNKLFFRDRFLKRKTAAHHVPVTPENFDQFSYSKRNHFNMLRRHESQVGSNPDDCVLKVYQDMLVYNFILDNFPAGAKLLEIGGGDSRIISWLKDRYEFWNLDKLEGVGNGLTNLADTGGFKLVQGYLGDFNEDLPGAYFDGIFSISVLEHVPGDEVTCEKICDDMQRLLKPGGLSLHCVDIVVKKEEVRKHPLLAYMYESMPVINQEIPDNAMAHDPDLWGMSKRAYDRNWLEVIKVDYETFGIPVSYNILWCKA